MTTVEKDFNYSYIRCKVETFSSSNEPNKKHNNADTYNFFLQVQKILNSRLLIETTILKRVFICLNCNSLKESFVSIWLTVNLFNTLKKDLKFHKRILTKTQKVFKVYNSKTDTWWRRNVRKRIHGWFRFNLKQSIFPHNFKTRNKSVCIILQFTMKSCWLSSSWIVISIEINSVNLQTCVLLIIEIIS